MTPIKQINKNGKNIFVFDSPVIAETPPYKLIFQCYNELLDKDMTMHNIPFRNNSSVIWIENDKQEVLGGIVYDFIPDRYEGWICLSFTDPKYRGKGINAMMHTELYALLRKKGAVSVGSHVSINNQARLNSAKKVGLEPLYYRMFKKL